jgi:hypothetical protein
MAFVVVVETQKNEIGLGDSLCVDDRLEVKETFEAHFMYHKADMDFS